MKKKRSKSPIFLKKCWKIIPRTRVRFDFPRLHQKKRERTQGAPSFSFLTGRGAEPARTTSAMYAPLCASLCYVRTRSACESGSYLPRSRGKLAYLRQVWRYSHSETPVSERTRASLFCFLMTTWSRTRSGNLYPVRTKYSALHSVRTTPFARIGCVSPTKPWEDCAH